MVADKVQKDAPFIIGVSFELLLLGMITAHISLYFRRGSKDPKIIRALLGFVVFCLFIKCMLNVKRVYCHFVFAYVGGKRRPVLPWTDLVAVFLADIPLVAAQSYLCYRLWVASQRKKWPAAIGVGGIILSTVSFLILFVRTVIQVRTRKWPSQPDIWAPLWAFSLCATDVYLSGALAYYLLRTRKRTVAQRLDYTLLRLALLAITTCIPPALVSAAMAILEITAAAGAGISWHFFTVILGSVYTLCILYSLNARKGIVEDARSVTGMKTLTAGDKLTIASTEQHPTGSHSSHKPSRLFRPRDRFETSLEHDIALHRFSSARPRPSMDLCDERKE